MALVIFDFDGTLYDSEHEVWRTISRQKEFVPELAVIKTRKDLLDIYTENFYARLARLNGQPVSKGPALARRMHKSFVRDYNAPIFAGVKDTLRKLAEHHTLAVVSSNYVGAMKTLLRRDGVLKHFLIVSGADKGSPKAMRVKELVKHLGVSARDVYYVTDTSGDVKEARKDGVKAIGVAWGFHPAAMLKKAGAVAIVKRPRDLLKVLDGD
jgi:phosphoglycolate phosphatase